MSILAAIAGLTVSSQEVVEQLEEREAVPGVDRLHGKGWVHVGLVQGQEVGGVFSH